MEKIIIEDFGPIEKIEFSLDKKFNIIIGEQAAGKSTLAKCIYYCKEVNVIWSSVLAFNGNARNKLTIDELFELFQNRAKEKFIREFGRHSLKKGEIVYYYKTDCYLKISLKDNFSVIYDKKTKNELIKTIDTYFEILNNKKYDNSYTKIFKFRYLLTLGYSIGKIFGDNKRKFFLPAGRSTLSRLSSYSNDDDGLYRDAFVTKMLHDIEYYKAHYDEKLKDISFGQISGFLRKRFDKVEYYRRVDIAESLKEVILKGKYEYVLANDDENERLILPNNEKIPIEFSSSGQQESLWILNLLSMILYEGRSSFIVIEEPEAHLFPRAQLELVKLIALVVNTTNSKVFITTHSPYILSSFNLLIYAGKIKTNNIDTQLDKSIIIEPCRIAAYKLQSGICKDIFNIKDSLIDSDEIDQVSNVINEEFDKLLYQEYKKDELYDLQ